jgi:hypothetical protein
VSDLHDQQALHERVEQNAEDEFGTSYGCQRQTEQPARIGIGKVRANIPDRIWECRRRSAKQCSLGRVPAKAVCGVDASRSPETGTVNSRKVRPITSAEEACEGMYQLFSVRRDCRRRLRRGDTKNVERSEETDDGKCRDRLALFLFDPWRVDKCHRLIEERATIRANCARTLMVRRKMSRHADWAPPYPFTEVQSAISMVRRPDYGISTQ